VQNPAPVHLQDEESLKRNIALGLVAKAMDFDILNPPASIVNRARDIIKLKETLPCMVCSNERDDWHLRILNRPDYLQRENLA
jgi:hypothetical protein